MGSCLLTIGIPIYNGDKYFRETLDSIVPQIQGTDDRVEILIQDNASTDDTQKISLEYQSKYHFIRYVRNSSNLEYDKNYDLVITQARGEYVWTFCDDDLVKPGSIQKILTILEKFPNLANLYINYSVYDGEIKICKDERAIKIFEDVLCSTPDGFYLVSQNGSVVASSNIYRKELWQNLKEEDLFETKWIQVSGLSALLIRNYGYYSYCIAEPLWVLRQNPKWINGGGLLKLTLNLLPIFQRFESMGYSKKVQDLMVGFVENNFLGIIITSKRDGLKVDLLLLKRIYKLTNKFRVFWVALLLLLVPAFIYRWVFTLIKFIIVGK
jgi:glycosyltransferase involved in cell wall biosynthesis